MRWSISIRVLVSAVTVNNPCIDKPNHGRGAKAPKLQTNFKQTDFELELKMMFNIVNVLLEQKLNTFFKGTNLDFDDGHFFQTMRW